jgi:hypothetical protein
VRRAVRQVSRSGGFTLQPGAGPGLAQQLHGVVVAWPGHARVYPLAFWESHSADLLRLYLRCGP